MLLSEILSHPYSSRYYLERYVNDGSPSGFSTKYTTRPNTSPFELNPWFHPYICYAPKASFKEYGNIPQIDFELSTKENNWIIVHPDMVENPFFKNEAFHIEQTKELKVLPTASGRTVQILEKFNEDYIKLHYVGILGRISRELPYYKAMAGPEISSLISTAIQSKILDKKISILPETGARVLINNENKEWGMIWRENIPFGLSKEKYKYLFPSFSLFSMDRLNNHHYPLLKQIIDHYEYNPEEYLLETILFPLIKSYFSLIEKLGLQAELNSQNLMLAFDENFHNCSFVLRDLESIDKDITLMKSLNLNFKSECYPYKCIEESQYNYQIKHSFMYDFKLGESILEPLINILQTYYKITKESLQLKIKQHASEYIKKLPETFFPKDKWYGFDKVLVDQSKSERPYLIYNNPKFR